MQQCGVPLAWFGPVWAVANLSVSLGSLLSERVLFIFGGATLKDFAFAMLVGIASGTYSSIFIASPVLTAWKEREPAFARRRQRIAEAQGFVPAFAEEMEVAKLRPEDEGLSPEEIEALLRAS